MNAKQFLEYCIIPVLVDLAKVLRKPGMDSKQAQALVLGTAMVESGIGSKALVQKGGGPALGIFQIEPDTWDDVINRYCHANFPVIYNWYQDATVDRVLMLNLAAGITAARIKYWMSPDPLPDTSEELAQYWKDHYNCNNNEVRAWEFKSFSKACQYVK